MTDTLRISKWARKSCEGPKRHGGWAVRCRLLKGLPYVPRVLVTDKLAGYGSRTAS